MEKIELVTKIQKELEEIGTLQIQKENVENELQVRQSFIQESQNDELEKVKRKKKILAAGIATGYFAFQTGIMPFITNSIANLPNKFAWLKLFLVENVADWFLLAGNAVVPAIIIGHVGKHIFEFCTERRLDAENVDAEISELERIIDEVDREIATHKNQLEELRNQLSDIQISDEIQNQAMIQYYQEMEDAAFFKTNVEMDIAKKPYTK